MLAHSSNGIPTNLKPLGLTGWDVSRRREITLEKDAVIIDQMRGSIWVTTQLRPAILDGRRYVHREKLPAKRQLAVSFGLARDDLHGARAS